MMPADIDSTVRLLEAQGYVADRALATVVFLSLRMGRPLFLEGEAGTGKTEIAKVLAAQLPRAERLAKADDVICNDGDLAALHAEVERLHSFYLTLDGGQA